jgi:hypothetical protein
MAVDVLKSRGVPEERILFINLIASPEGIKKFIARFPKMRVVTAFVDQVGPLSHALTAQRNRRANAPYRDWTRRSLSSPFIPKKVTILVTVLKSV